MAERLPGLIDPNLPFNEQPLHDTSNPSMVARPPLPLHPDRFTPGTATGGDDSTAQPRESAPAKAGTVKAAPAKPRSTETAPGRPGSATPPPARTNSPRAQSPTPAAPKSPAKPQPQKPRTAAPQRNP
jgi:hypothetical protein